MSKSNKVVFSTVAEVSVEKLIEASKGHSAGQRKMRNNEGRAWSQTLLWLHGLKPLDSFDDTQEVKDIAEDIRDEFKSNFLVERDEAIGELDSESEGRNARTGKMVPILDAKGEPKWSSWEETKLPIAYCTDMARIVKAGIVADVIPSANKVMGRTDALKLAKTPETPLETIKRSVELIENKLKEIADTDAQTAANLIEDIGKIADALALSKAA